MNEKEFIEFVKLTTASSCEVAGLLQFCKEKGLFDEAIAYLKTFMQKIPNEVVADVTKDLIQKAKDNAVEK